MSTAAIMTESDDRAALAAARRQPFHPLEIIPFFRRWKCSPLRDVFYTFLWNDLLGLIFSFINIMFSGNFDIRIFSATLVIANLIGFTIHVLFMLGSLIIEPWVFRRGQIAITLYYASTSTLGVFIGFTIAALDYGWNIGRILSSPSWYISIAVNSLIISIIIGVIYFWRERMQLAEMRLQRERTRIAEIERNATMANLRMLQAQIEPHFLFNTLANVTSLIHPQPDKAKQMLESFIHYLRGSLKSSREERIELGQEFALMKQFLAILQIRMGGRLGVDFNLPDSLATVTLPPMLVQPLVENAIKHGLEPKIDGGTLSLSAEHAGNAIRIVVSDTGLGFNGGTSSGMGLKNVRDRLKTLYGDAGKLIIEDNVPTGTRVIIEIPA